MLVVSVEGALLGVIFSLIIKDITGIMVRNIIFCYKTRIETSSNINNDNFN